MARLQLVDEGCRPRPDRLYDCEKDQEGPQIRRIDVSSLPVDAKQPN